MPDEKQPVKLSVEQRKAIAVCYSAISDGMDLEDALFHLYTDVLAQQQREHEQLQTRINELIDEAKNETYAKELRTQYVAVSKRVAYAEQRLSHAMQVLKKEIQPLIEQIATGEGLAVSYEYDSHPTESEIAMTILRKLSALLHDLERV